jgi:hypothetical protein
MLHHKCKIQPAPGDLRDLLPVPKAIEDFHAWDVAGGRQANSNVNCPLVALKPRQNHTGTGLAAAARIITPNAPAVLAVVEAEEEAAARDAGIAGCTRLDAADAAFGAARDRFPAAIANGFMVLTGMRSRTAHARMARLPPNPDAEDRRPPQRIRRMRRVHGLSGRGRLVWEACVQSLTPEAALLSQLHLPLAAHTEQPPSLATRGCVAASAGGWMAATSAGDEHELALGDDVEEVLRLVSADTRFNRDFRRCWTRIRIETRIRCFGGICECYGGRQGLIPRQFAFAMMIADCQADPRRHGCWAR